MSAWTDAENASVVEIYFEMLLQELKGRPYNKSEHNRRVQTATGRGRAAVEFKFCNVSHVLANLGFPYIDGYKPRSKAQQALWTAVQSRLEADQTVQMMRFERASTGGSAVDAVTRAGESAASFEHFCERLWDRATGGTDVAARPDNAGNAYWPTALRPPGVEEALTWFTAEQPAGTLPRWLFLVGGPGAGKSHATAVASAGMTLTSRVERGLANRTYEYSGPNANLFIINDATINSTNSRTPLAINLEELAEGALDEQAKLVNAMACVNRGIIIEELAALKDKKQHTYRVGSLIMHWLHKEMVKDKGAEWTLVKQRGESFARSATLEFRGRAVVRVLSVSVDECSLFEKRPSISVINDQVVTASEYDVSSLEDRSNIPEDKMVASDLLLRVLASPDLLHGVSWNSELAMDPIAANYKNMMQSSYRSSLLSIARSAEIATGSRMTYREVWGYLVRAFVGSAPQRMERNRLFEHLRANQPNGSNAKKDFYRVRELSEYRLFQGIFGGSGLQNRSEDLASDPVLRLTAAIDPLRDALPGYAPDDPFGGWATPIAEAFTSHFTEQTPLNVLRKYDVTGVLGEAITDFDEKVDGYFVRLVNDTDTSDDERLAAISWYGAYLTRLYAVTFGISAFRAEVSLLIKAQRQDEHLPDSLQVPMHTLIRPKRNPDAAASESLIPMYESRTDPVTGTLTAPKLAVRVGDLELKTEKASAEQTLLTIHRSGRLMAKMALDFALVREALTCAGERAGVTDLVEVTAPRLERIRAARLLAKQLKGAEIRVVEGDGGFQISQRKGSVD